MKLLERVLMAAGLLLLGFWAAAWAHGRISSWASLRAFEDAASAVKKAESAAVIPGGHDSPASQSDSPLPPPESAAPSSATPSFEVSPGPAPVAAHALSSGGFDFSLWSVRRVSAYRESLKAAVGVPLAVLRIPKIGVVAPVLEGTDDVSLNRGVGHIEGTPRPGEPGNVGIAGHRDGFFRGLKDVLVGDQLEVVTPKGTEGYRIDRITIVAPEEVSVLDPTASPHVTLVTCYPFYFVGDAPQRYIVRASRVGPAVRR